MQFLTELVFDHFNKRGITAVCGLSSQNSIKYLYLSRYRLPVTKMRSVHGDITPRTSEIVFEGPLKQEIKTYLSSRLFCLY